MPGLELFLVGSSKATCLMGLHSPRILNEDCIQDEAPSQLGTRVRLDGPLAKRHKVRLIGTGEELVVFSHGLGTDQTAWAKVVGRLPPRFTAMVYDLPGAGPLLPADFDVNRYGSLTPFADDLLELLDELGVTRCRYVGHSVSGMIGALAAIEAPERFEKLVLLTASPRYLNDVGYTGGFAKADLDGLFAAMSANYQAWVTGFAPLAIGADAPDAVREFTTSFLAMRPDVTLRIARMIFESDVRHLLPLLEVPTVLVHARSDIVVPDCVVRFLNQSIRTSEVVWIDTVGHLPHLSAPDEIVSVLRTHLP